MIQRKQSLYLLISALLVALLLVLPLGSIDNEPAESFTVWSPMIYLGVLVVLAVVVPMVTIFRFRAREFQLRMCIVQGVLLLGIVGFEVMGIVRLGAMGVGVNFSPVMLAPLGAGVLVFMAFRAIMADMALLKSADRIR